MRDIFRGTNAKATFYFGSDIALIFLRHAKNYFKYISNSLHSLHVFLL